MIPDQLRTANLFLRPFSPGDTDAVFAYWKSDPGWEQFNASVPSDFSRKDAGAFVQDMISRDRNLQPNWALLYSGTVVGVVSLSFEQGHARGTVGYGIHADQRGHGRCGEAVETVLDCAFSQYAQLAEIRAYTDRANSASIRVLSKLGFAEIPVSPEEGATYGISRSEWENRK